MISTTIPYWGQSLLRVLGVIVAVLAVAGTFVYVYLFKMVSFMQSRLGPMEAGPFGSMQLLAEVAKFLRSKAPEILEAFGTFAFDPEYDYKKRRQRS